MLLFSRQVVSNSLQPHGLQHTRSLCPSPSPKVFPSSCPLHWWYQTSHLLTPSSPSALNLSQQQGLFQWDICSHQMTKILELQLQHHSFQWIFWVDLLAIWATFRSPSAPQFEGIDSLAFCLLCGPALITVHDHWEDHSLDYTDICWQSDVSASLFKGMNV